MFIDAYLPVNDPSANSLVDYGQLEVTAPLGALTHACDERLTHIGSAP